MLFIRRTGELLSKNTLQKNPRVVASLESLSCFQRSRLVLPEGLVLLLLFMYAFRKNKGLKAFSLALLQASYSLLVAQEANTKGKQASSYLKKKAAGKSWEKQRRAP